MNKKQNNQKNKQQKILSNSGSLTTAELAERWKVAIGTLTNWRNRGQGPNFMKLGSRVAYRVSDIESYEKKNLVN